MELVKRRRLAATGLERVDVAEVEIAAATSDAELIAVSEALDQFALIEPKKAELVKLRYFVGLSLAECQTALGISEATAVRWWNYAKVWLYQAMRETQNVSSSSQQG